MRMLVRFAGLAVGVVALTYGGCGDDSGADTDAATAGGDAGSDPQDAARDDGRASRDARPADATSADGGADADAASVATELQFVQQPADTPSGQVLDPAVVVGAIGSNGDPAAGFSGEVTLSLAEAPGDAALLGTLRVRAVEGRAEFADLAVTGSLGTYRLRAEAGELVATSEAFELLPDTGTFVFEPAFDAHEFALSATSAYFGGTERRPFQYGTPPITLNKLVGLVQEYDLTSGELRWDWVSPPDQSLERLGADDDTVAVDVFLVSTTAQSPRHRLSLWVPADDGRSSAWEKDGCFSCYAVTPHVDDRWVYWGHCDTSSGVLLVEALDRTDGTTGWDYTRSSCGMYDHVSSDDTVAGITTGTQLTLHDREDGTDAGSAALSGSVPRRTLVGERRIYLLSAVEVVALDRTSLEEAWRTDVQGDPADLAVGPGDALYVVGSESDDASGDTTGFAERLDPDNGESMWRMPVAPTEGPSAVVQRAHVAGPHLLLLITEAGAWRVDRRRASDGAL